MPITMRLTTVRYKDGAVPTAADRTYMNRIATNGHGTAISSQLGAPSCGLREEQDSYHGDRAVSLSAFHA